MKTPIFLFLFILFFIPTANAATADLTISAPETISETRITRTIFEYVMRAKITNPGPAAAAISATVTSSSPTSRTPSPSATSARSPPPRAPAPSPSATTAPFPSIPQS